jgi:hypothetical protein
VSPVADTTAASCVVASGDHAIESGSSYCVLHGVKWGRGPGAAQEYAGCPEWLGEGERCSSCHDDHNDDRAEEVRCRACNGPLSEARLALGLTLCSGACHRAIRTAQKPDPPSDDRGSALVSLLLAVCIVGGLLGLAVTP